MDPHLLRICRLQVFHQCRFTVRAADDINASRDESRNERVFYGVQNFLNSAANISKMLWGSGGKRAAQRKHLRDSLGVSDDMELRSVTMRNNFEHLDERIDYWWTHSRQHHYIDMIFAPRSTITGPDPTDMFRWLDPETGVLIFWGQEFNLNRIMAEVDGLLVNLDKEFPR